MEHLKLKAGDSILDVGTGSGGFAFYLAEVKLLMSTYTSYQGGKSKLVYN